jgi:formamidopyrimidine-DNA glycosylase
VPELPEVEVLVRHLNRLLPGRVIRGVHVLRPKIVRPTPVEELQKALAGARFVRVTRRGKFLLFQLKRSRRGCSFSLLGHLGMTGRMYVLEAPRQLPKHAAVVLDLGEHKFVFEDTRYFGRFTLDCAAVEKLGVEPLGEHFTTQVLSAALQSSRQPIKVKLLDQAAICGVGNIYASEVLHLAGISPLTSARSLSPRQLRRLHLAIQSVLIEAVAAGSTVPLNFSSEGARDGLFYYGSTTDTPASYEERLRVYDRAGAPCLRGCGSRIERIVQGGRSTYFCPRCQPRKPSGK